MNSLRAKPLDLLDPFGVCENFHFLELTSELQSRRKNANFYNVQKSECSDGIISE